MPGFWVARPAVTHRPVHLGNPTPLRLEAPLFETLVTSGRSHHYDIQKVQSGNSTLWTLTGVRQDWEGVLSGTNLHSQASFRLWLNKGLTILLP